MITTESRLYNSINLPCEHCRVTIAAAPQFENQPTSDKEIFANQTWQSKSAAQHHKDTIAKNLIAEIMNMINSSRPFRSLQRARNPAQTAAPTSNRKWNKHITSIITK
jgi:hypothetical protein